MCIIKHIKYSLYNILNISKKALLQFPYLIMNCLMIAGVALASTWHKTPRLCASDNNAFHI